MRKTIFRLIILVCVISFISACKKENDEVTYSQGQVLELSGSNSRYSNRHTSYFVIEESTVENKMHNVKKE